MELMQASQQWSSRPADERFTSLLDMQEFTNGQRNLCRSGVVSSRKLTAMPVAGDDSYKGLVIGNESTGNLIAPTHWSFGQLATRAGAPAGYLRTLPAPMAADCINYGMKHTRDVEELGVLVECANNPETGKLAPAHLRAATGPNYGRIWNSDIVDSLVHKFGNGLDGNFRVPGEFGQHVDVTKENTTLYASDRDMFVFLADETNRVTIPNRRDGKAGTLARGFFVWNSEVGDKTCGAAFFLFDYACKNRIVWGAEQFKEIRLRHTSGAPDRWLESITPVLKDYAESSAVSVEAHLIAAQNSKVDDVKDFLSKRYTAKKAADYIDAFARDENREMESLWDITTGMTAFARSIKNTDDRVAVEREAGKILAMAK